MIEKDIETQLESVGLNKSEIKVYFSLLKLGASSTGPIIQESKTANSKVYEVLEKLIEKGLVSYFTKQGVKQYKAAPPKMILEYLKEKRETIKKQEETMKDILPSLVRMSEQHEEEKEASVFTGPRGIKTVFLNLVEELKTGEEVHIMGVHDFGKKFMPLALYFQNIRSHKKIKAKFLMNKNAKDIAKEFQKFPPTQIKFLKEDLLTPAIFLIYKDKIVINLAKDLTAFVIKSKNANIAFESYFQILWKNAKS